MSNKSITRCQRFIAEANELSPSKDFLMSKATQDDRYTLSTCAKGANGNYTEILDEDTSTQIEYFVLGYLYALKAELGIKR